MEKILPLLENSVLLNIRYGIPKKEEVKLAIYNPLGRKVKTLQQGVLSPGWYKTELNLRKERFASGIYWLILEEPSKRIVKKLILLR